MDDILVSINCITYNHEKYIATALESFLMQKTNFKFEIIIGEDCSTDNTRKVVEEYVKKYPEKIKMITSDKNVGGRKNSIRLHNASSGKYIALCEGDDYWIDEYKLQKQIDYMEKNNECTMCFHNAKKLNDATGIYENYMIDKTLKSKKCTIKDILNLRFLPTASVVYRKYTKDNLPDWYMQCIVGDLPSHLIVTDYGYAYYFDEVMSIYRVGNINSAMNRWKFENKSINKKIENLKGFLFILDKFDLYSNYKYEKYIDDAKKYWEFQIKILEGDIKGLKDDRYNTFYTNITNKEKIKIYLIRYVPYIYTSISYIKLRIGTLNRG